VRAWGLCGVSLVALRAVKMLAIEAADVGVIELRSWCNFPQPMAASLATAKGEMGVTYTTAKTRHGWRFVYLFGVWCGRRRAE
jgi:hypothetical protein